MSIEIIDEPPQPLRLTRAEHDRLWHEYQQAMMFYAGHPIDFESWCRGRLTVTTLSNGTLTTGENQ